MKIWHSGAHYSPCVVNGVNSLIYTLAREQATLGHEVTLLIDGQPDEAAHSFAMDTGVQFLRVPPGWSGHARLASLVRTKRPDLVHMHSVFIPRQWTLGNVLTKLSIPFVITPNGGFSPHILARSAWKKAIYSSLLERPRLRKACGISVVTPKEEFEVRSFLPQFDGRMVWIPNAFDPNSLESLSWLPEDTKTIVYMGRFDVVHKGIDILLDIAKMLLNVEFHLYGPEDEASNVSLVQLKQSCTPNVFFHPPVYGVAKIAVLARATLYLQMSRWEAFGISIAEAMYVGLPCILASTLHLASVFEDYDLGLVVPPNPQMASDLIRNALLNPVRLQAWSRNAREFAVANFHPRPVALRFLEFYEESVEANGIRHGKRRRF
jgi:glycosyltransferase involved in cell wall biosynthesis